MHSLLLLRHVVLGLIISGAGILIGRAEPTIAFSKEESIYTASADGENVKKICDGSDPCISPDGRFIVYTKTTDRTPPKPKDAEDDGSGASFTRSLCLRELATGQERTLPTGKAQQVYGGLWSSDGQWIAFNLLLKGWQVAVVKPDGTELRVLTEKLTPKEDNDFFLAGWNYRQQQVLVQDLETMAQISPTGTVTWKKTVKEVIGADSPGSYLRCTISSDGGTLIANHQVLTDEFKNLDGPSSFLVLVRPPGGKVKRVTRKRFDVASPWLDPAGQFILFRGFAENDVVPLKEPGSIRLKVRIYRFDMRTELMAPLIEGGDTPSMSQK
jgi:TolB protein